MAAKPTWLRIRRGVYVFSGQAGAWTEEAYVKASNTDHGDLFAGVALNNGILAAGAPGEGSCASGINDNQTDNSCADAAELRFWFS